MRSPVRFPARSSSIGYLGVVSSPTGSPCAVTPGLPGRTTPRSPVTRTLRVLAGEGLVPGGAAMGDVQGPGQLGHVRGQQSSSRAALSARRLGR
jgi:hypothetical protein